MVHVVMENFIEDNIPVAVFTKAEDARHDVHSRNTTADEYHEYYLMTVPFD